jgi:hypothetical protein
VGPGALAVVVCDQAGWHQRAPGARTRSCALRPASGQPLPPPPSTQQRRATLHYKHGHNFSALPGQLTPLLRPSSGEQALLHCRVRLRDIHHLVVLLYR